MLYNNSVLLQNNQEVFVSTTKGAVCKVEILKRASAGTLESSDIYVEIEPGEGGVRVELESVVKEQFGEAINQVIREVLSDCGVENATVRAADRGALECVIRARVETAVLRGKGDA